MLLKKIIPCFVMAFLGACGDGDSDFVSRPDAVESSSSVTSQSSSSKGLDWSLPKEVYLNPEIDYGTTTDERDGKTYKTVKIGDQTWMAENLNYSDSVATESLKGRTWCYNDVAANCDVAGRLYIWEVALNSCPAGWHLPTQAEWDSLFTAVGGRSTAGKFLRSQTGWYDNGNGTDAFGFSALPAGERDYFDNFHYDGLDAYFWSSTEFDSTKAYRMFLHYSYEFADLCGNDKGYAYSIRCLKD